MAKEYLPGHPSAKRVKDVRRFLASWGIRPQERYWAKAWEWAWKVASSYFHVSWPLSTEIAMQYLFVLLTDMRVMNGTGLRLPFRAKDHVPPSVTAMLAEAARLEQVRHAGRKPTVLHLALTHEELNDLSETAQAPSRRRAEVQTTLFPLD